MCHGLDSGVIHRRNSDGIHRWDSGVASSWPRTLALSHLAPRSLCTYSLYLTQVVHCCSSRVCWGGIGIGVSGPTYCKVAPNLLRSSRMNFSTLLVLCICGNRGGCGDGGVVIHMRPICCLKRWGRGALEGVLCFHFALALPFLSSC